MPMLVLEIDCKFRKTYALDLKPSANTLGQVGSHGTAAAIVIL